ncbi:alanine racemase [Hyphococcus flavus]|uniref:Alanine racemase n=1 Tax=Hyphococcus flavus TaxID=1866326 RepID=A0AAE9ZBL4_9PROT|nr:alanine racemase [Hyphococcus flavus]WDI31643.1 alanine racemase [Hyphococcus flavus]
MMRNIARMRKRFSGIEGVSFRPHLKTAKSIDIARRIFPDGPGAITVSTLLEAEHFAEAGFKDILYAVALSPDKLPRVQKIRSSGVDLCVIVDSAEAVHHMQDHFSQALTGVPFLIEIDCDGCRAGVPHRDGKSLLAIADCLTNAGAELRGVMTHAGGSYLATSSAEIERTANEERARTLACAAILREAGYAAPTVSIGSTPTALAPGSVEGITEIRAGVFVFFDLVMASLNVCSLDEIALSVLTSVIGRRDDKRWVITDAGWMALSRDQGIASHGDSYGYGLACDINCTPVNGAIISGANQEHGIMTVREGSAGEFRSIGIGERLRILPNHACATAAQHLQYYVVKTGSDEIVATWPRFNGW